MKRWNDCANQSEANAVTLSWTQDEAERLAEILATVTLDGAEGEDRELLEDTISGLRS